MKTALLFVLSVWALNAYAAETGSQAVYEQAAAAFVKEDYAAAHRLLLPLAEKDEAAAQYNLGVLHEDGLGVPADDVRALQWYERAAVQGHAEAQFAAGLMYAQGKGTAQDYAKAAAYYRSAAEQGHAEAQNNLAVRYAAGSGVPRDLKEAQKWFAAAAAQGNRTAAHSLRELEKTFGLE